MLIKALSYEKLEYYRLEGFYEIGMIQEDGLTGAIFTDRDEEYNMVANAKSTQDRDIQVLGMQYPSLKEWIEFTITLRLLREET